jgi:uncharacterized protein YndB with AHSA1/START domain
MQITKFFSAPREAVFEAFTNARKLEKWCYPEGLTLTVPKFEARENGRYRYVHQGKDGIYNCEGHFDEFQANEHLTFVDEKVTDPDGNVIFENLNGSISFRDKDRGTEIHIIQEGFIDDEQDRMCEQGWVDSLINLSTYLGRQQNHSSRDAGGRHVANH